MQNKQKYISFIVVILLIVAGVFFFRSKNAVAPTDNIDSIKTEIIDTQIPENIIENTEIPVTDNTSSNMTKEQETLLIKLRKSVNDRDFETFASLLQEVYKNQWNDIKEFTEAESNMYVYATNTYWVKGDLANSLRVSTVVYSKVSGGWRFRYLRIVTLEKYGRNAFNAGDLTTAENYANQILQMMYRIEGANLLADIYISKIQTNIKNGDIAMAQQNLIFIWDYEVSQDRRETLRNLKTQLGL